MPHLPFLLRLQTSHLNDATRLRPTLADVTAPLGGRVAVFGPAFLKSLRLFIPGGASHESSSEASLNLFNPCARQAVVNISSAKSHSFLILLDDG